MRLAPRLSGPNGGKIELVDPRPEPRRTMNLTIRLPPETERKLLTHATATGKPVSTLVEEAIAEKLERVPSFDEVCESFRQAVEASGITDDELDSLFREALAESRREKRGKNAG